MLQLYDPQHRPWQWQLLNIIIFCRVHFRRTVIKLVPETVVGYEEARERLMSLLDSPSEDDYNLLLDLIISKYN